MYIEQIKLTSWKAFKQPTVLDLIPGCIAVGGKNGSGKSNIIDAIMFAFNDSSHKNVQYLSIQLRIERLLSELICSLPDEKGFKAKKATVELRIKVLDPQQFGFSFNRRQIMLNRTIDVEKGSKLRIDGKLTKAKDYNDFICQLGFSTTNPQFWVKQGQVSRVTNQKPKQFLAMIQNCLGIQVYVKERLLIEKKFEREEKDHKMGMRSDEILEVKTEIVQLKKEQEQLRQQIQIVLAEQGKVIPYRYLKLQARKEQILNGSQSEEQELEKQKNELIEIKESLQEKRSTMKELYQNQELARKLKGDICYQENQITKKKSQLKHSSQKLQKLIKQMNLAKIDLPSIQTELEEITKKEDKNFNSISTLEQDLSIQQQKLVVLSKAQEGQFSAIQKQELNKESRRLERESEHFSQKEAYLRESLESSVHDQNMIIRKIENSKQQVQKLKKEINELQPYVIIPEKVTDPLSDYQIKCLKDKYLKLLKECDPRGQTSLLKFVKTPSTECQAGLLGRVFQCFTVENDDYLKALQTGVSRGKLNFILVSNQFIGQKLIQGKCFPDSFTANFMPINNVSTRQITHEFREHIKTVGIQMNGTAKLAVDLLNFQPRFERAMKYLFGNFVITSDIKIANAIAFSSIKKFQIKCITISGDVIDPAGTMSGGNAKDVSWLLPKVMKRKDFERKLKDIDNEMSTKQAEYQTYLKKCERYKEGMDNLQDKRSKLEKAQEFLAKHKKEFKQESDKEQLEQIISRKQQIKELWAENKEKLAKVQSGRCHRGQQLQNLKTSIQSYRKIISEQKAKKQKLLEKKHNIKSKINFYQDILNDTKNMRRLQSEIEQLLENIEKIAQELSETQFQYQEMFGLMIEQKIRTISKQIKVADQQRVSLEKSIRILERKVQDKLGQSELRAIDLQLKQIELNYNWIHKYIEIHHLNFKDLSPNSFTQQQNKRHRSSQNEYTTLNNKLQSNITKLKGKFEEQIKNVEQTIQNLQKDKDQIRRTCNYLDAERVKSLKRGIKVIRSNFQKLISFLIPQVQADLVYQNQNDINDGLKMLLKYQGTDTYFGRSQLSGGQKTLISFGFISSMLLYNPSPIYLFDQFDAALDEDNCMKLTKLITHFFKDSQFIVISHRPYFMKLTKLNFEVEFVPKVGSVVRRVINNLEVEKKKKGEKEEDVMGRIEKMFGVKKNKKGG